MGPPSQTPPILVTTPGSWKIQLLNDDPITAIVDAVMKVIEELKIVPDSKGMQTKLNNRLIQMNSFLDEVQSEDFSDIPSLTNVELLFTAFEIPEVLSKQLRYLVALPCLTLGK